jgi:hypothetical protein
MEPVKDQEADTYNKAIETIFKRVGVPESIRCDEGSFNQKSSRSNT